MSFCLDDGSELLYGPAGSGKFDEPATAIFPEPGAVANADLPEGERATAVFSSSQDSPKAFIASPNNLSDDLTALIGREKEIAEIESLLGGGGIRLLTMTGVGGTGKTRLAQAVAWRMLLDFPDGVFFVNLAPITDPKLVTTVIAQTLGVQESGSEPILEALKMYLAERKMMLVVDNFEQVSQAASDIEKVVNAAPNLRVLITSRELLRLRAEREFVVSPLALPLENERLSAAALSRYESIRFFVECARAVRPDFELTETNAADVSAICRNLDGLPFAIELAAARIKLFEPQTILSRLSSSLRFLTGGAKERPERHQTMRGAIAWSYDLLNAEEKRLLGCLSVFAGGFTIDSAEAVGAERGGEILDTISSLLDKNLIERVNQQGGDPRFRMLVVVREFALEKLELTGTGQEVRHRHAWFFAQLAELAEPELRGSRAADWLKRLGLEHENLRLALNWTIDREPETALRIAASIQRFWWRRGHLSEGVEWTRRVLDANATSGNPKLLASAYRGISSLSWSRGDFDAAVMFAEKGLEIAFETGDKKLIIDALHSVGTAKHNKGDFAGAQKFSEDALTMAREAGETFAAAELANALGELARHRDDYPAAQKLYEETLMLARQNGFQQLNMLAAINLAAVACQLGDYQASHTYTLESMQISEELGSSVSVGYALERFAALAVIGGEMERSARLSGAMEAIYDAAGYRIEEVDRLFLERYLDEARSAIGEERFALAQRQGRALSVKDAIALAREGENEWRSTKAMNRSSIASHSAVTTLPNKGTVRSSENLSQSDTVETISSAEYIVRQVKRHRLAWLAAAAFIVLGLGGFLGYRYLSPAKSINSIAVMPFENRNSDADTDYLSDGLAESLIFRLTQVPDLKVSPTSSVMRYKGKETDISKIASELGVDAVMTGRLTKRGDNLYITVELVDARTNKSLWGEQYERKLSELLTTQREIVTEIVNKLQLKLSGESEQKLTKKYTDNPEAYQLYLQGRYHWSKRTGEEYKKAVDAYQRAIGLDKNFALAYVGIADTYNSIGKDPVLAPKESVPLAKAAATQALEIDPTLAEAHSALADSIAIYDWDWATAEREFRRASELDANVGYIHLARSSSYLAPMKRTDEMLGEMGRALELEPLSLINNAVMVTGFLYARENEKALNQARKAYDLDPSFRIAYHWLGSAYIENRMYDEAVKLGEDALRKWPNNPEMLFIVGHAYARSGRQSGAEQYIGKIRDVAKTQYVRTYWLACIYAALGDKDKAFAELERSYQDKDCFLPRASIDPAMDPLRDDPRFKDLLKRMNLPE